MTPCWEPSVKSLHFQLPFPQLFLSTNPRPQGQIWHTWRICHLFKFSGVPGFMVVLNWTCHWIRIFIPTNLDSTVLPTGRDDDSRVKFHYFLGWQEIYIYIPGVEILHQTSNIGPIFHDENRWFGRRLTFCKYNQFISWDDYPQCVRVYLNFPGAKQYNPYFPSSC